MTNVLYSFFNGFFLAIFILNSSVYAQTYSDAPDIIPEGYQRGMIVDAGSGGSRLHIFSWKPRIFHTIPPDISYPSTEEKWTERSEPGISTIAEQAYQYSNNSVEALHEAVESHFAPLIAFAKNELRKEQQNWGNFPIYVKATGGVREMPYVERENLMAAIRNYLLNSTNCPFFFRGDFARVISGEEEGVFSWTGVNLLMGTLINPSDKGHGAVHPIIDTYGVLDLGGASTQISFFVQSQDILEGLFKMQLGSQRHWNVYTRSFLQFGHVSARKRHFQLLAAEALQINCPQSQLHSHSNFTSGDEGRDEAEEDISPQPSYIQSALPDGIWNENQVVDHCLLSGYSERIVRDESNLHILHDHSASKCCLINNSIMILNQLNGSSDVGIGRAHINKGVLIRGPEKPESDQFDKCFTSLVPLMEKKLQGLCSYTYGGQCSIGGSYQPALPTGSARYKFIGTSSYRYIWRFLQLPATVQLSMYRERARSVCSMDMEKVTEYVRKNNQLPNTTLPAVLPYYCFMASYYLVLLTEGYGFTMEDSLTVRDLIDGHKVGWPLGAMLYEINGLPWSFSPPPDPYSITLPTGYVMLMVGISMVLGGVLCLCIQSKGFNSFVKNRIGIDLSGCSNTWWVFGRNTSLTSNMNTTAGVHMNTGNRHESVELLGGNNDGININCHSDSNGEDNCNSYHGKSYQSL